MHCSALISKEVKEKNYKVRSQYLFVIVSRNLVFSISLFIADQIFFCKWQSKQ